MVVVVVVGAVLVPARPAAPADPLTARGAALYFLRHYEEPDGRVVRWDQGGDSVSEGQAYAMLLSEATGAQARFEAAWRWTEQHLLLSSGLLAWHWQGGRVTGSEPAADADVDAAYALELAGARFHQAADTRAARRLAAAIVRGETVRISVGRILTGGPWADGPTIWVDPSYASPAELTALGALGERTAFDSLAATLRLVVQAVLAHHALPPDWVTVSTASRVVAGVPPGTPGGVVYGFDAVRLPVRWAASCDRAVAARLWPVLEPRVRRGRPLVNLTLSGGTDDATSADPIGLVGAAGAAWAAGDERAGRTLLDEAQHADERHPTYYDSAWVALGRELLETSNLGSCAGS